MLPARILVGINKMTKMKKTFIYLAVLAIAAIACSKEPNTSNTTTTKEVKMIIETITAQNGDGSAPVRAAVDAEAKFSWTAGDQIAVHVSDGSYYTTEALVSGGINSATFSVTYPDGQSRDAFAVYPASIVAADAANYGQTDTRLDVTLPGSYAITDVSGEKTPCPMIAANTTGDDWTFNQLCGMLRLTVDNIPADATYLEIDFNDKKVQGNFSVSKTVTPGTSVIQTTKTSGTDDIITITGLTGSASSYVINLPLPTGTYYNVNVTAYNSSDEALRTVTRPMKEGSVSYAASRAKGRRTTTILHGLFSVGASSKVDFAFGNLQANTVNKGSIWTWRFAQNQWEIIGESNNIISGNGTTSSNGSLDLFGWVGASNTTWSGSLGTTLNAAMYGVSDGVATNDTRYYGNVIGEVLKSDWGNTIGSSWSTPTITELAYLFDSRTTPSGIRFAVATVNSVGGVILLPDDWSSSYHSLNKTNTKGAAYSSNTIDSEHWASDFEAYGAVFLPATGYRNVKAVLGASSYGRYWTSTSNESDVGQARALVFNGSAINTNGSIQRYYGQAVRLVRKL